jgi:hypothetical protein
MSRLGALIVAAIVGCGGPKKPTPEPPPKVVVAKQIEGSLTIEVEPNDAEVEVDGTSRGLATALKPISLVQGAHQIVIKKPGFEIWRGEVEIKAETERIQVKLVPLKK